VRGDPVLPGTTVPVAAATSQALLASWQSRTTASVPFALSWTLVMCGVTYPQASSPRWR
jgi:hypothetical protein